MSIAGPALLGFAMATIFTWLELVTSKYPQTFSFLRTSKALYAYCVIYGLIAFFVLLGFNSLVAADAVKVEGVSIHSPWVRAVAIGIATKALLHIRLFTVTTGTQAFPVGVESVVQIFEPWLLDRIAQNEFDATSTYTRAKATKYTAPPNGHILNQIQANLIANIRRSLPAAERAALALDINKATTADEAMSIYLARFGRSSLDSLYP